VAENCQDNHEYQTRAEEIYSIISEDVAASSGRQAGRKLFGPKKGFYRLRRLGLPSADKDLQKPIGKEKGRETYTVRSDVYSPASPRTAREGPDGTRQGFKVL